MPKTYNWVSRLTGFFLARTQISLVLFLFVLIGGLVALAGLRHEGFPKVPVKVVVISTIYRGAAATEVEQSVTNPIESAIKDLTVVKSTSSTSGESSSTVVATLNEDADVDSSVQSLTSKLSGVELPKEAEKPNIIQPMASSNSSFIFGLTGNLSGEELLEQGRIFEREISQIKGIKQVKLQSQFEDRVTVTFDPSKLAAAGVDSARIQSTLAAANLNFPAGESLTIDGSRATVLVAGRYASLEDLARTPLPTVSGGTVRLSEVATVKRGIEQNGQLNRIGLQEDGAVKAREGIVYGIDIRADADVLRVQHELTQTINRLSGDGTFSRDLILTRLFDDADSTEQQIDEIKAGAIGENWKGLGSFGFVGYLFGGIWLLMLAMFMFVNLRSALIAGLAIPLSFLFTLMALYWAGISLNTLTLFSMVLVLGLVVDPAIVVLESIQRYKDMGRSGREGLMDAVNSIGRGLLIATICSIIVFTPFGIVSGVFGEIIKFIPITVIPALVASFFVPLIFLAPLAGRFIKPRQYPSGRVPDEEHALWGVSRWFKRTNLFILRHVSLQIVIILLAVTVPIALTAYLFASGHVKSAQFSKPKDSIQVLASVSYPASSTDAQIHDLATKTEGVLADHPEITNYYYMMQGATGFTIYINLNPIKDRQITADEIAAKIKTELPRDPSAQIYSSSSSLSYGPPEQEFPIQVQVYDADLAKLKTFALALAQHARSLDGVTRVSDGYTDGSTKGVQVNLDTQAAAAQGLSAATVGAQLAGLLGEQNLTKLTIGDDQLDVVAAYAGADKYNTLAALKGMVVAGPKGPVRLEQIATFTTDGATGRISHQDGQRYATVRAQVAAGTDAFKVQRDINNWAKDHREEYKLRTDALESKGEGDEIAKSFTNLFTALGIAILMIYLLLALFFGSFLKPIIITFALPLSFLGVFPILAVLGTEFGFLEILGLITLAGLVVNVGIFVIDYANHKVAEGMPVKEAVAQATAVRFRPIFLTKVVALGSLLPLAILSPFWRGLASVIICGILASGVLSLFTTPILYTWFSGLSKFPGWLARKFGRRSEPPAPPQASPAPARPVTPSPQQRAPQPPSGHSRIAIAEHYGRHPALGHHPKPPHGPRPAPTIDLRQPRS